MIKERLEKLLHICIQQILRLLSELVSRLVFICSRRQSPLVHLVSHLSVSDSDEDIVDSLLFPLVLCILVVSFLLFLILTLNYTIILNYIILNFVCNVHYTSVSLFLSQILCLLGLTSLATNEISRAILFPASRLIFFRFFMPLEFLH